MTAVAEAVIHDLIKIVKVIPESKLVKVHLNGFGRSAVDIFVNAPDPEGKHTFHAEITYASDLTNEKWSELNDLLQSDEWYRYVDGLLAFHFLTPAPGSTAKWNLG